MIKEPTASLHVGTAHACGLVGLDKPRFNQMVVTGSFTECPPTRQAVDRKFALDDVIVLNIYADALRAGMGLSAANSCAQAARGVLLEDPGADTIIIGELEAKDGERAATMVYGKPDKFDMHRMLYRGRHLSAMRTIPLGAMRARLLEGMERIVAARRPRPGAVGPRAKRRPILKCAS